MIGFTDKEIAKSAGRKVVFEMDGKHFSCVIRDFWGAGHYWVKVDGEPKDWSVSASRLRYAD